MTDAGKGMVLIFIDDIVMGILVEVSQGRGEDDLFYMAYKEIFTTHEIGSDVSKWK